METKFAPLINRWQQIVLLVLALAAALAGVFLAYVIWSERARSDIRETADRQLQMIGIDVESALEKYETLPFVLACLADVSIVLQNPHGEADILRLNQTIRSIQVQSKVAAIYVMDRNGVTVATSNWEAPLNANFTGKNFSFRPYFRDSIAGKPGRFYAIWTATNEPGYFISEPVYGSGGRSGGGIPIGVVAVKIRFDDFEKAWRTSEDPVALVDRAGVIFLSNHEEWRYHSLNQIRLVEQQNIANTFQYGGRTVTPVGLFADPEKGGFGPQIVRPVDRSDWRLILLPSEQRAVRSGIVAASVVALFSAIVASLLLAAFQHKRRIEERFESRKALQLAADELDQRISQSTTELRDANRDLGLKYMRLKETESLLRTTQNELVRAGKFTMLGQMVAGITHELSQPLTAIRAFADNAVTLLSRHRTAETRINLEHISGAAARMGTIISQLKGFARERGDTLSTVDLAQAIHASMTLLNCDIVRNEIELNICIHCAATVLGDATRIEQVLINLLRNAIDATEGCVERSVSVSLYRSHSDAVILIRDTGPGISREAAKHLFEPFFTTKPFGRGLGLGLAISSSIVQAMEGDLTGRNCESGGAEFLVRLPLCVDAAPEGNIRATA